MTRPALRCALRSALRLALLPLALLAGAAFAQNPLAALLGGGDGLTGTEERLLHRKPAGPYTVSIDGNRIIGDAYLRLDVRGEDGERLGPDASVVVRTVPPAALGAPARDYDAVWDPDRSAFVVDPLELTALPGLDQDYWQLTVRIDGATGAGETSVGLYVYPPKLEPGPWLAIASVALPLAVLALFGAAFAWRRTALLRPAAG